MSGVVAGLLGITLKEARKQVGLSFVSTAAGKVFAAILASEKQGADPEVKKDVETALQQLRSVREDIKKTSTQIADFQVSTMTDIIQQQVTTLEALETQYFDALPTLSDAAKLPAGPDKDTQYGKC
jgi:hypothetical protein